LRERIDPEKAVVLPRFFKTGPGQYGEGDKFLGVAVPGVRQAVKPHLDAPEADILALLRSEYHEERLAALVILVGRYRLARREGDAARQEAVFRFYLANTGRVNNWDLVDLSAPHIVGAHLFGKSTALLTELSASPSVWERRIAIIATHHFIREGDCRETFRIARRLLGDRHDLIHKAVGWMLREAGKRCSLEAELAFLDRHRAEMPRTALRYAIERFPEGLRRAYLAR
jgi:3-methyladenine DNA glycosylase AlkD